jgi:hypothetical protein
MSDGREQGVWERGPGVRAHADASAPGVVAVEVVVLFAVAIA